MKILGVSFGRKDHNCDIVTKQALMAAREAGAEVKFINTMNMVIGHCKGCGACSASRDRGKQIKCVLRDDYLTLEEAILDADGVIVAAPIYALGPTGQLKNYDDRFGAAHDLSSAMEEQKKRIKEGKTGADLLDERMFKDKYVAYISVGGCHTPNWVSMGLPNFYMFGMSTGWHTVGQIDAYDMGHRVNPVLDDAFSAQTAALGRHLVEQIKKPAKNVEWLGMVDGEPMELYPRKPYSEVEWFGEQGVCPVCHNKLISISESRSTTVECPLCGTEAELSIEDGKIKVTFSEEQIARSRNTIKGLYEHHDELHDMMNVIIPTLQTRGDEIAEKMKPIKAFESDY